MCIRDRILQRVDKDGDGKLNEQERAEARKAKDFSRADAIRDRLSGMGVEIMDSPEGTTWRRK